MSIVGDNSVGVFDVMTIAQNKNSVETRLILVK